jgi:predicted kinase
MTLILIRGLPGSGKSTHAKLFNCFHVEADMYHYHDGKYCYENIYQKQAHKWCLDTTEFAMKQGLDVCVSNTFTQRWEIQPYIDIAKSLRYEIIIIRKTSKYNNIHDVPEDAMKRMEERFENIYGEKIIP